jgi:hypothetical protein
MSKAIPVTGRGGLQGCEVLRISRCLDDQLTDGGKAVRLTSRLLELSSEQDPGPSVSGRIR